MQDAYWHCNLRGNDTFSLVSWFSEPFVRHIARDLFCSSASLPSVNPFGFKIYCLFLPSTKHILFIETRTTMSAHSRLSYFLIVKCALRLVHTVEYAFMTNNAIQYYDSYEIDCLCEESYRG